MRWPLQLLAVLALALAGCGGGTTAALPPPGSPDPAPDTTPGTLSGSIVVEIPVEETVLEAEPNDTFDQAHFLGELSPGRTIAVLGHADSAQAAAGADGFRLLLPERSKVTATVQFENATFTLGVWDFSGLQFVEEFAGPAPTVGGTIHAKGVVDLVLTPTQGASDYILTVRADALGNSIPEIEPNDGLYGAQFVGELLEGDTIITRGEANRSTDAVDGVTVTCPSAVRFDILLFIPDTGLPQTGEFDLEAYDITGGEESPPLIDGASWDAGSESATLAFDVADGTLVRVLARCTVDSARYALVIRGKAPEQPAAPNVAVAAGGGYGEPALEFVAGEALVVGEDHGCEVIGSVPGDGGNPECVGFCLPPGLSEADAKRYTLRRIESLRRGGRVERAEPNYIWRPMLEPDDEHYGLQWHYPALKLPAAWEITTGDDSVIVAVLDTGQTNHPDLAGRQMAGYDFISSASAAKDGDGVDPDPTDEGDEGLPGGASTFHGTHVAGTIGAATDNGEGVAGVTWKTRIMHLRVIGVNGGTTFDVANAILYAAGLPNSSGALPAERAHVINMSLGGPGGSQAVADAVASARAQGVVVFASAGNSNSTTPLYPASHEGVISIGATDLAGNRAPYSSYGSTLDLMAPGGDLGRDANSDGWPDGVLSTRFNDSTLPAQPVYTFFQGTSMACPHAAGVAALMLAVDPDLSPDEIEEVLKSTARDLGPAGVDAQFGHGLIDAHAALLQVLDQLPPVIPPELVVSGDAMSFQPGETARTLLISNAGGDPLVVDPPTVVTQSGAWLSASLLASSDPSTNASGLEIRVDRAGMEDGAYFGRVLLASNGGSAEIQVLLRVQQGPEIPADVDIYVRAVNVDTGEIVRQALVNPSRGLDFTLDLLPPATYRIEAGSDPNRNGVLCEPGELCGLYPLIGSPILIALGPGETRGPFVFTVAPPSTLPSGGG